MVQQDQVVQHYREHRRNRVVRQGRPVREIPWDRRVPSGLVGLWSPPALVGRCRQVCRCLRALPAVPVDRADRPGPGNRDRLAGRPVRLHQQDLWARLVQQRLQNIVTVPCVASQVTTVWHYRNSIISIIIFDLGRYIPEEGKN